MKKHIILFIDIFCQCNKKHRQSTLEERLMILIMKHCQCVSITIKGTSKQGTVSDAKRQLQHQGPKEEMFWSLLWAW